MLRSIDPLVLVEFLENPLSVSLLGVSFALLFGFLMANAGRGNGVCCVLSEMFLRVMLCLMAGTLVMLALA
jgi:hypothetical protein